MIPPKTILSAVDFSEPSRVALGFAARLAVQCGSALHVLHVQDPLLCAAAQHEGRNLNEETLEELRRFAAETWPAPSANPRLHTVAGRAHDVILDIAARESADVIVVGSRGMSSAERLIFGSTTEYVLRRADVSVIVVPPTWTAPVPDAHDLRGTGPLVAGLDFDASSVAAAGAACWLAGALDTSVEVVHVVEPARVLARWQPAADRAAGERAAAARRELAAVVKGLGTKAPVDTRVEAGDVAGQLTAVVGRHAGAHPLLVVGRKAGGSRGGAPGAIAYRVLTNASVPVLVYLPGAQ